MYSRYTEQSERVIQKPYLVDVVVVLGVELEDLRLLLVVESGGELIGPEFLTPLLRSDEPAGGKNLLLEKNAERRGCQSQK